MNIKYNYDQSLKFKFLTKNAIDQNDIPICDSSWQKKVYEYAKWMFEHDVAFDEIVYFIKKYLKNVSDRYFVIMAFDTRPDQS